MSRLLDSFTDAGFVVCEGVLAPTACRRLLRALPEFTSAGARDLLNYPMARETVGRLRASLPLSELLSDKVAVQCTAFIKSQQRNWAVRLHRDRVIPASGGTGWKSSGIKDGLPFVQPSREVLASLVAVRLNLDHAAEGDLQVVPGSHRQTSSSLRAAAQTIPVPAGGVLLMSPLIEHASAKLKTQAARRVLHFLFGPRELPNGYRWCHAF